MKNPGGFICCTLCIILSCTLRTGSGQLDPEPWPVKKTILRVVNPFTEPSPVPSGASNSLQRSVQEVGIGPSQSQKWLTNYYGLLHRHGDSSQARGKSGTNADFQDDKKIDQDITTAASGSGSRHDEAHQVWEPRKQQQASVTSSASRFLSNLLGSFLPSFAPSKPSAERLALLQQDEDKLASKYADLKRKKIIDKKPALLNHPVRSGGSFGVPAVSSGYAQVAKSAISTEAREEAFCRQVASALEIASLRRNEASEQQKRHLKAKLLANLRELAGKFAIGVVSRTRPSEDVMIASIVKKLCHRDDFELSFGDKLTTEKPEDDENQELEEGARKTAALFEQAVKSQSFSLQRSPLLSQDEPEVITLRSVNPLELSRRRRPVGRDAFVVSSGMSFGQSPTEQQRPDLVKRQGQASYPGQPYYVRPPRQSRPYYPQRGAVPFRRKSSSIEPRPVDFQSPRPPFLPPSALRPKRQPATQAPRTPQRTELSPPSDFFGPGPTPLSESLGSFIEPPSRNWQEQFYRFQRSQAQHPSSTATSPPQPRPTTTENYFPQHPVSRVVESPEEGVTLHQVTFTTSQEGRGEPLEATAVPSYFVREAPRAQTKPRDIRQTGVPSSTTPTEPGFVTDPPSTVRRHNPSPARNYTRFDRNDALSARDDDSHESDKGQPDLHFVYNVTFYSNQDDRELRDDSRTEENYYEISPTFLNEELKEYDPDEDDYYYSYSSEEQPQQTSSTPAPALPGFRFVNEAKRRIVVPITEPSTYYPVKSQEEVQGDYEGEEDPEDIWGTRVPPVAAPPAITDSQSGTTTPRNTLQATRRPTVRLSPVRIPPLPVKIVKKTKGRHHIGQNPLPKGIGGAEIEYNGGSSGIQGGNSISMKKKTVHPSRQEFREPKLPENLLDPSTLRRRNLTTTILTTTSTTPSTTIRTTPATTTTTITTTTKTTTTTTATTTASTASTTRPTEDTTTPEEDLHVETYFPTTGAVAYEYEYDSTSYPDDANNAQTDWNDHALDHDQTRTGEEQTEKREEELYYYIDNELIEEDDEGNEILEEKVIQKTSAVLRNDRFAKAGLPHSQEVGSDASLASADSLDEAMNPEKLAYILIGVCCGLSILCLIVVAVSIGYKSETHYRLDDGRRKRHIKLLKASLHEDSSSSSSPFSASTTSSRAARYSTETSDSSSSRGSTSDPGMKLGPWFNKKHSMHTLERKSSIAFPTSVYLENLEGAQIEAEEAMEHESSEALEQDSESAANGSISSFDTLRADPNLLRDPDPALVHPVTSVGGYKKKKASNSSSFGLSTNSRTASSSSASKRAASKKKRASETGSFRFLEDEESAPAEEQQQQQHYGKIQWSSNSDRLI